MPPRVISPAAAAAVSEGITAIDSPHLDDTIAIIPGYFLFRLRALPML
jgi:hypothetical protein